MAEAKKSTETAAALTCKKCGSARKLHVIRGNVKMYRCPKCNNVVPGGTEESKEK
jgi:ribosomal protein L37AE/L43A